MSLPTRIGMSAVALLAAAFLFALSSLPESQALLPPLTSSEPAAVGALHIHTNRSDGSGSPDEVAADAARAGLTFIVLTDHGDATRRPDPPAYRSGVLVIDAVELSTDAGHYIAIGLPQAPYPLARRGARCRRRRAPARGLRHRGASAIRPNRSSSGTIGTSASTPSSGSTCR